MRSDKNKQGAWREEEDRKLGEAIAVHGAAKWKLIATKAGLSRTSKSCRLRWLNYLRPNIKRGNISDQEEDLILRLHKLLGNRWSLIAGRLPGRTDNEIKNYWNSHLSKKLKSKNNEKLQAAHGGTQTQLSEPSGKTSGVLTVSESNISCGAGGGREHDQEDSSTIDFNIDDFFDFSDEDPLSLNWINKFLLE